MVVTAWGGEAPPPNARRVLRRRALASFVPYRRQAVLVVVCIIVGALFSLVPALVAKGLIDSLTGPNPSFGQVVALVTCGVGASLAAGFVWVGASHLRSVISFGIMYDFRNRLFDRLLNQSVDFFTNRRKGDLLSRLTSDVSAIEGVVSETIFGIAESAIVGIATLSLMAILDWRLTILVVVVMPALIFPARRVGTSVFRARKAIQEKLAEISIHTNEVLGISGRLLAKAFGTHDRDRDLLQGLSRELRDLEIRRGLIGKWVEMATQALATAAPGLLWLYGGYLVIHGEATVGTVGTFVALLAPRLASAAGNLGSLQLNLTGSLAVFDRIFTEIDRVPSVTEAPMAVDLCAVKGCVSFSDVSFSYRPELPPALDRISFEAKPGQLVALVGPSGAGKTTVTSLLCRFYDPQRGEVRIDGHDLRDVTMASIGGALGVVFQDSFLINASVRDNLLYAKPDATEQELETAARASFVHDFITSLPDGYDTVVGERGHRLSGGERQRIAIARVILKDPPIVVLDEATSHLDSVSERLIQTALTPLFAGRTSLVIAHRLSTVMSADIILVLDHGRVVERGRHSDLIAAEGLYANLYERQFAPESQTAVSSAKR